MATDNRRTEIRKEIRIPLILEKNGVQTKGLLIDLSEHGLGFISSINLKDGETVQLILSHNGSQIIQPISLQVKIQNNRQNEHLNRFGALITELQESYQNIINQLFHPSAGSRFAKKMQVLKA